MKRNPPTFGSVFLGVAVCLALTAAWSFAGTPAPTVRGGTVFLGPDHWRDLLQADVSASGLRSQIGSRGFSDQPDEFGGGVSRRQKPQQGPSHLGEKIKAGLLSAVLPGAGQFYNGRRQKAYIMGGVEVAIWTAYFVFDSQGDHSMSDARDFAGIYAGTHDGHDDNYWQHVARFMDSDAFNEDRYREARALQEPASGIISDLDSWQWVNQDRMYGYRQLRADAASAYDRRDFMILFAVVNRAVSVVDAVMGAGKDDPTLGTEVMGMNVRLEVAPVWTSPAARCVVSRSF